MAEKLVLTFDCGTQSLRAMVFDQNGNLLFKAQQPYEKTYHSLRPGYAEQKPETYWDALCAVSNAVKAQAKERWADIACVSVTTIRDTYACFDAGGKPLRDFIVWLDQREAKCREPMPVISRAAFALVGMTEAIRVQRKITKSNWIRENEPEIWQKTHKYLGVSGYLNFQLTGSFRDGIASQVGHIPFDYKNKKWKTESDIQFPMFAIELDKLPELVPACGEIGKITAAAAAATGLPEGLPVIASGSDKGCETLGLGGTAKNIAFISFGTASTLQITTDKYVEPMQFIPAYPAVAPGLYNPEVQIYRGYWMISWFMREFAEKEVKQAQKLNCSAEELLNKRLNSVAPGCDGLILQPYWSPMLKTPEARGSILGFSAQHTRIHIYRAIVEGVNFALLEALESIRKRSGAKIDFLCCGGGGSRSDAICQITADMFGLPVRRIQTYEASGLGAAMACFVACGVHSGFDSAAQKMIHYRDTFTPDKAANKTYREIYSEVYSKIYCNVKPLYKRMYEITKNNKKEEDTDV